MEDSLFAVMIVFVLIAVWVGFYWLVLAILCVLSIVGIISNLYVAYRTRELKGLWILIILIPVAIYTLPFFGQLVKIVFAMIFFNS